MLDASPQWQTALHALNLADRAKPADGTCGVWANELPQSGFISLRGDASDPRFASAVARATGATLPAEPCSVSESGDVEIFWLSPDEWIVSVPLQKTADTCKALNQALSGVRHQVADNSGGYTQIAIRGPKARDVLSHCTIYDLGSLGPGRIVGTTFGKLTAFLRVNKDGYTVLVRRSFASYVWAYLERAAQPYGFGVAALT